MFQLEDEVRRKVKPVSYELPHFSVNKLSGEGGVTLTPGPLSQSLSPTLSLSLSSQES